MNAFLWAVQGTLAAVFVVTGLRKAIQSEEGLKAGLPALGGFSLTAVRLVAVAELAGAAGLVLPAATGIAPVLTPLAAVGLAVIMVLAARTHLRRREYGSTVLTAVLFLAAAAVVWGRFVLS
ncbi:DoxX family protein [Nonomuraea phyllanthi]|uniref:DoxX family protein n=1 Tax=Nonomuraea phyllanthi TaxID=2219224 RepID=A0A5C4VZZ3_9ACTN|nr:DoxX family protein [Nonomuraea phyllanthi]KAB8190991.1 DoxX family protein [Nonomuraea phyllanthi]